MEKKYNKRKLKPKYRKSIIDSMKPEKIKKYGFKKSYFVFERSIANMAKEGDEAEEMAVQFLKDHQLLSEQYSENRVIALRTIKIEADIIDYGNKIVYETKSRRNGDAARKAIKDKWRLFEYDKRNTRYHDYQFCGIVVVNYDNGKEVEGLVTFEKAQFDKEKVQEVFRKHKEKVKELSKIQKEPRKKVK